MSIYYRKVRDNRPDSSTYGMWFGKAVNMGTLTTEQLAKNIAWSTTVTEPDVLAVLKAAAHIIEETVNMSQKVKLDNIGTLSIGLKTTGATTAEKFDSNNIVGFRINFLPERITIGRKADSNGKLTFRVVPKMTVNSKAELFTIDPERGASKTSGTSTSTSGSGTSSVPENGDGK